MVHSGSLDRHLHQQIQFVDSYLLAEIKLPISHVSKLKRIQRCKVTVGVQSARVLEDT